MGRAKTLVGCLLGACLVAVPTHAENATDSERSGTPKTRQAESPFIDEIVVTVSKRTESLQEVLGSVTALSGEVLANNNIQDFRTLAELIPGMVVQRQEAGGDEVAIRGVSRTRDGPSPVAFHTNDVFLGMRGEPYYDLRAVEVLRGPSGTVFGRNATAGAINAKWRRPDAEWSTGGDLRYSALTEQQLRAHVNIPLLGKDDPRLLARIAAVHRQADGTMDNLLASSDKAPNNIDERFVRIFLSSEPTDALQLGLRAIRYESEPRGSSMVFSPSRATRRSGELEAAGAQRLPDNLLKVRSRTHENFGEAFDRFTRVDGDVHWSLLNLPILGDVDIVMVGGYQRREAKTVFDFDGTEAPILEGSATNRDDVRRSGEIRLLSQNASGIDWLLGLFAYRQTGITDIKAVTRAYLTPALINPLLPPFPEIAADIRFDVSDLRALDDSRAIFANVNINLAQLFNLPNIELTAGLRHNRDKFEANAGRQFVAIKIPGVGGEIPLADQRDIRSFASFQEVTGEAGARWFYHETGMFYLKFARGYKPGFAQSAVVGDEVVQNPVDAEQLDAWEAGWKVAFFNRALQLEAAVFDYDYRNLQVSQITPGGVMTENAAASTIRGAEVDLRWMPNPAFMLRGGLAWTDARYDKYCGTDSAREAAEPESGCNEDNPFNFAGERMTAAPGYSVVLMSSYSFDLGSFGSLTPIVKISWLDWMDRRGLGNSIDRVRSHSNSDVRVSWQSAGGRWKVDGFIENIENHKDIFTSGFAPIIVGRPDTYTMIGQAPRRVYGILMEVAF